MRLCRVKLSEVPTEMREQNCVHTMILIAPEPLASSKICLPLSLILATFHRAHTHNLSGNPSREKVMPRPQKTTVFQTLEDG